MQYVRSISGSVSKTWNSINPATLSGAIDVIVVEQEDGSLECSPFHIRYGKFSLLRPYEKKVEFKVNGQKQDFPMKLGEGGEAFFVFETRESVPEALQTSPLVSPVASPELKPSRPTTPSLQEPDLFELESTGGTPKKKGHTRSTTEGVPITSGTPRSPQDPGRLSPLTKAVHEPVKRPLSGDFLSYGDKIRPSLDRIPSDNVRPSSSSDHYSTSAAAPSTHLSSTPGNIYNQERGSNSSFSDDHEARLRAMNLSKKLWTSNISNHVTESGDLMLDMTGYKSGNFEALHAEGIARQLLSEELVGPYDLGALIGADEKGNIWIYSSEKAKEAAGKKASEGLGSYNPTAYTSTDALSDPGYHSDDARSESKSDFLETLPRRDSDSAVGLGSHPSSPGAPAGMGDRNKNYAKTLRLTSEQLKSMNLKTGANTMTFTVNRATCNANLWYWQHDVPIVISDIDGTITKSDVLGHLLNTLGRDWTHYGVAKLYTEIASNGYNLLYLTSRSVGQADTTRAYLDGVVQEGFRLPKGPVILSPDRTMAALRREIYLRKPEVFKMACLRDIMALFSGSGGVNNVAESAEAGLHAHIPNMKPANESNASRWKPGGPFYAGFGNRLTDALSYRSVNIPSTRIFTINSNSEISLDLLSLNKYKTAYSSMREIVDHYFPPIGLLVKGGGEDFTDFNYWRDKPYDFDDFTDSEDGIDALDSAMRKLDTRESVLSEDEAGDNMGDSFISDPRMSLEQSVTESATEEDDDASSSLSALQEEDEDGDDEEEEEEVEDDRPGNDFGERGPVTPEPSDSSRNRDLITDSDLTPRRPVTKREGNGRSARRPGSSTLDQQVDRMY